MREAGSAPIAGRSEELERLGGLLSSAAGGRGAAVIVSGEPGIGKTRLVDEFSRIASSRGVTVLRGSARRESARPYHALAEAVGPEMAGAMFDPVGLSGFSAVFLLDASGEQVAVAGAGGDDASIAPGMLAKSLGAVQDFLKDTFDAAGGLDQLEIGGTTVMMARGGGRTLAGLLQGASHPGLRQALDGAMARMVGEGESSRDSSRSILEGLAAARFAVRKDLEGARLESERARVAGLVLDHLAKTSAGSPTLLVLEDVHWADGPTLHAFGFLARNARPLKLMILSTMRRGESAEADAAVGAILAEGMAVNLALGRLEDAAVAEIIGASYSPNDFPASFPEGLARDCAGNPLFAVELLRHMAETGSISFAGGRYALTASAASTPASLAELVERRLASLDPEVMAMAEYCSCMGREFSRDVALGRPNSHDPEGELAALGRTGIASSGAVPEFTHALFQEVTYRNLSPRWKTVNHRAIGEAYERSAGGGHVFELARHFHLGAVPGKAVGHCRRAGELAEASFAAEQGIGLYRWALEDAAKALRGDELAHATSDLRERIGDLLLLKGDYPGADSELAAALAHTGGRRRAHLLRKRALALERQSRFDDALALLPEAHDSGAGDGVDEGKTLATESFLLARKGDYDRAATTARKAAGMLEGSADRDALVKLVRCHNVIAINHRRLGQYDESVRSSLVALDVAVRSGDERSESVSYSHLGNVYWLKGDNEKALEYHSKDLAIATRRKDPYDTALALANIGNVYLKWKDYASALDHYRRALSIRERIGDRLGVAMLLNNLGVVSFENGDVPGAAGYYRQALAASESIGDRQNIGNAMYNLGEAEMTMGRFTQAREVLSSIRAKALEWGLATRAASVLVMMAENELRAGDDAKARELAFQAVSESERQGLAKIAGDAKALLSRIGQA